MDAEPYTALVGVEVGVWASSDRLCLVDGFYGDVVQNITPGQRPTSKLESMESPEHIDEFP